MTAGPAAGAAPAGRIADYVALTKPRLNALAVFAVAAGAWSVGGGADLPGLAFTIAGAGAIACGSSVLNQWMERDADALMRRTEARPLPAGRLDPRDALLLGCLLGGVGVAVLFLATNVLTGVLGLTCLVSYVAVYTPLKRRTTLNTLVGTIPGALPPVMGVAAARGEIGAEGLFLFAMLAVWQLPHFLSIAWLYREDYRRGGFVMLPGAPGGEASTARQVVVQTLLLCAVTLAATPLGLAGRTYFVVALVAGLGFLAAGLVFALRRTDLSARWLLRASLLHLPLVLTTYALDRVVR